MPFTVRDLIQENPKLVTVKADDPVRKAFRHMVENDFSQLPVVDDDGCPRGLITHSSILSVLGVFNTTLDKLHVEDAVVRAELAGQDDDLFALLDKLQTDYAVLVVDDAGGLAGIVTNYDTTEYFRRKSEDIMRVEDIEGMLKDLLIKAFGDDDEGEARLADIVQRLAHPVLRQEDRFVSAVSRYLHQSQIKKGARVDKELAHEIFIDNMVGRLPEKTFEHLTFGDYVHLLLSDIPWNRYEPFLRHDKSSVEYMLDRVRRMRNALAHFRGGDLTDAQRDHLITSAEWLRRISDKISATLEPTDAAEVEEVESDAAEPAVVPKEPDTDIVDAVEEGESRYAPLGIWLQKRPLSKDVIKLAFKQVEQIIGGELPDSAFKHRAWWANNPTGHPHSRQWLDAGWRVATVAFSGRTVRFARIKERQRDYIEFFGRLAGQLRQQGVPVSDKTNHGTNWHHLISLDEDDTHYGSINAVFARRSRFRIELYIDTGDQVVNNRFFDALEAQKEKVESALGKRLDWQRLDERRAARIALHYPNEATIADGEEALARIRQWAVDYTGDFYNALAPVVMRAGRATIK